MGDVEKNLRRLHVLMAAVVALVRSLRVVIVMIRGNDRAMLVVVMVLGGVDGGDPMGGGMGVDRHRRRRHGDDQEHRAEKAGQKAADIHHGPMLTAERLRLQSGRMGRRPRKRPIRPAPAERNPAR